MENWVTFGGEGGGGLIELFFECGVKHLERRSSTCCFEHFVSFDC